MENCYEWEPNMDAEGGYTHGLRSAAAPQPLWPNAVFHFEPDRR